MSNLPATKEASAVTPFDADRGGLQITDSGQMFAMAKFFAQSELVPKDYRGKPANIIVAWQQGAELGLSPTQSLQGIAVINGRATLWGEATTAVVLASGLCEQHRCWHTGDLKTGTLAAHCSVKRRGMEAEEFSFSIDDAKTAGLWGKGTYLSYPKDMLLWKAKARAYRSMFADVLKGIALREDMDGHERPAGQPRNAPQVVEQRTLAVAPDPLLAEEVEGKTLETQEIIDTVAEEEKEWHPAVLALAGTQGVLPQAASDRLEGYCSKLFGVSLVEIDDDQYRDVMVKINNGEIEVA